MGDVTELSCWPVCIHAIDWSEDGIIALATDERVEVIFPNTITSDAEYEYSRWQQVSLKVPLFTREELPDKDVASLTVYSVGEEISASAPIAIAWSPAGLAKYRRCALAVLTGNLVLSIWTTDGNQHQEINWVRKMIVNRALHRYFDSGVADEPSRIVSDATDKLRLRCRVRAFAWARPMPTFKTPGVIGTPISYGQHIVAIANDDNQIVLIIIKSPTAVLGAQSDWTAEVAKHFPVGADVEDVLYDPSVFEDVIDQQRYASHIAWSPWILKNDHMQSVIAYASNKHVRARIVKIEEGKIDLGPEILYANVALRYHGPLTWSSNVDEGHKMRLTIFAPTELIYLMVSCNDASIISTSTHDLDGRWDQVSGVGWDDHSPSTQRLHFASLLSTLNSATAAFDIVGSKLQPASSPSWKQQIQNNLASFNDKNNLKGYSKAKVWGLTISPLGSFIATCNTVHPSDMIEYGIPADRQALITIETTKPYEQIRQEFPNRNISAESLLYAINKIAENVVEDDTDMPAFAEEMVGKLVDTFPPPQRDALDKTAITSSKESSLETLVYSLKMDAVFHPETLKDRYTLLVAQACNTCESTELLRALIAYRLAKAVLMLPLWLSRTPFSAEVMSQHRHLLLLINELIMPTESDQTEKPPSTTDDVLAKNKFNLDTCDFCSADISFSDLANAMCVNGHRFPRCGLSFVAIQAPGISKYCGICKTPYLSEDFVAAQERGGQTAEPAAGGSGSGQGVEGESVNDAGNGHQQEPMEVLAPSKSTRENMREHTGPPDQTQTEGSVLNTADPRLSLANVLFQACDMCIYCGGKFAD